VAQLACIWSWKITAYEIPLIANVRREKQSGRIDATAAHDVPQGLGAKAFSGKGLDLHIIYDRPSARAPQGDRIGMEKNVDLAGFREITPVGLAQIETATPL
jgi:hypothetical protein